MYWSPDGTHTSRDDLGPVVQLVRTLACHARGRGFESHPGRQYYASVAQLVEHVTENHSVVGSIPTGGTNIADLAHLVERDLAKVEVAGSSPVIRSKTQKSRPNGRLFCVFAPITGAKKPPSRRRGGQLRRFCAANGGVAAKAELAFQNAKRFEMDEHP